MKTSKSILAIITAIIPGTWKLDDSTEELRFELETGERGPRLDHGGGENGDDWMDDEQQDEVRLPYEQKWNGKLADIQKNLEKQKLEVYYAGVDYGEKGHITLMIGTAVPNGYKKATQEKPTQEKPTQEKPTQAKKEEAKKDETVKAETPKAQAKEEAKKVVAKAKPGETTTTIEVLPLMPSLKIGDTVKIVRIHKGTKKENTIEGTIKRFFHHNKLKRNEVLVMAADKKRKYILEDELVAQTK